MELEKLEPNITGEILTRFKTELETEVLNSLKSHCKATEHVLRLICKLCSTEGHSIDACKLAMMPNNHCQYCKNMGHEVAQSPTIAEYRNGRKEDTIRLRAIRHQELRYHAKAVAVRHTRLKIARQHCVRGATTSGTQ